MQTLTDQMREAIRIPYALRRIPESKLACLLPQAASPQAGEIALARLERVGKNARLELVSGRACTLHEGDLLAVVFGNRYATEQFEGHARPDGDACDLLSMGGMCGTAISKHASMAEPTRLRLLGALGDPSGRPLRLQDFALAPISSSHRPRVIAVCGTSMDAGKTHTMMSLIVGLRRQEQRVAAIKLTGTAAGRDTWTMLDAGASPALNFVDGGLPSTYLCTLDELLRLHRLLLARAAAQIAAWVVIEIADGLLQQETAALLQCPGFTATVDQWVFAAGDSMAALAGVQTLRGWGIEPVALSGRLSMSPLGMREAEAATGVACLTATDLQRGDLNARLIRTVPGLATLQSPYQDQRAVMVAA